MADRTSTSVEKQHATASTAADEIHSASLFDRILDPLVSGRKAHRDFNQLVDRAEKMETIFRDHVRAEIKSGQSFENTINMHHKDFKQVIDCYREARDFLVDTLPRSANDKGTASNYSDRVDHRVDSVVEIFNNHFNQLTQKQSEIKQTLEKNVERRLCSPVLEGGRLGFAYDTFPANIYAEEPKAFKVFTALSSLDYCFRLLQTVGSIPK